MGAIVAIGEREGESRQKQRARDLQIIHIDKAPSGSPGAALAGSRGRRELPLDQTLTRIHQLLAGPGF